MKFPDRGQRTIKAYSYGILNKGNLTEDVCRELHNEGIRVYTKQGYPMRSLKAISDYYRKEGVK